MRKTREVEKRRQIWNYLGGKNDRTRFVLQGHLVVEALTLAFSGAGTHGALRGWQPVSQRWKQPLNGPACAK